MLLRVLTLTLALTGAAVAQEAPEGLAESIGSQVKKCWNLLPSDYSQDNVVELDIVLRADGSLDGSPVIANDLVSFGQKAVGRAAQRAVVQCTPYDTGGFSGPIRLIMDPRPD